MSKNRKRPFGKVAPQDSVQDTASEELEPETPNHEPCAEEETTPETEPAVQASENDFSQVKQQLEKAQAELAEAAAQAEALKAQLAEASQKRDEYLNMAQRVQADFENFRRRNQNTRKEAYDDGTKAFATTLLPVIDNFERAIAAAANTTDESLKSGVEMVYRQMTEAFEKRGITPIDRLGEAFDPNVENAVMQGTPEEGEPGTVCAVFQKGYQMDGKLLRAAMVKVVPEA